MYRFAILVLLALVPTWAAALPKPGLWRPVDGEVGAGPVAALTHGGDGALWAAGAGRLFRRPDAKAGWQPVGLYAPALRWDEGNAVDALGPFPPRWLDKVANDALRSLESVAGPGFESGEISEDVARQLLRAYTEELDPPADSPYRVVRMLPAVDGVWLATGAGLFRADKNGVRGPVGTFTGIRDLVEHKGSLWVATDRALWSLASDGLPVQRRVGAVDALAATDEALVFLADETVWTWNLDGEPVRRGTPTGVASTLAAQGDTAWVATALALYRWQGGAWRLCPPLPDGAVRFVPLADGLIFLGESRLYFVDATCTRYVRQQRPWPGDAQVLDAVGVDDGVWLSTSEGVHRLVPPSHATADAARVGAFRRALRDLPSLDQLTRSAMRYQGLDRASRSFGWRPALSGALPTLAARYMNNWKRIEDEDRGRLLQVEVERPRPEWRLMAEWEISFDVLGLLFDVERGFAQSNPAAADLPPDAVEEAAAESAISGDGTVATEGLPGLETVSSDAAFMLIAAERRQGERDRQKLIHQLGKLYRERMRIMFRLWVEVDPNETPLKDVFRLREIDAAFDALTGGEFSRLLAAARGTLPAGSVQ